MCEFARLQSYPDHNAPRVIPTKVGTHAASPVIPAASFIPTNVGINAAPRMFSARTHLWLRPFALLTLLLGTPATALAVGPVPLPEIETRQAELKPGTWVQYAMFNRRTNQVVKVRLAALHRVANAQWLEFSFTDEQRQTFIFKVLIAGALTGTGDLQKAIMQIGGQQPILLPSALMENNNDMPRLTSGTYAKGKAKPVGVEKIRVVAGTFKAMHFRRRDKRGNVIDAWLSNKLRGWPLVKFRSSEMSLELTAHGKSGQSRIIGAPQPIDPKLFQHMMPPSR